MIVTCKSCDTSFQLDEERVPKQGIRVRCSRCKEAFFLEHPSSSQSQAIDEIAIEAAQTATMPQPDATQDLPPSSQLLDPDATVSVDAGGVLERPAEEINNEDDAEWEFNRDPLEEVDSGQPAAAPADGTFGGIGSDGSSGLDLASPPEPEQAADDSIVNDEIGAAGSAFGSVDDFSSLMEEDDSPPPSSPVETAPDVEEDEPLLETLGGEGAESILTSDPSAGLYAGAGGADELGEPESWDFFSDDSLENADVGGADSHNRTVLERIERTAPEPSPAEKSPLPSESGFDSSVDDWEYGPEAAPPSTLSKTIDSTARAMGWLATTILIVIGLVSGLWNTAESLVTSAQVVDLDRLRAESIRGKWVDTVSEGKLLLVTGELTNSETRAVEIDTVLQVALLGPDGGRLTTQPAPAGIGLSEADVRELSAEDLWAAQNRAAFALTQRTIEPGGVAQFQALFAEVPAEAVRFAVEFAPTSLGRIEHVGQPAPAMAVTELSQAVPASGLEAGDGAADGALRSPSEAGEAAREAGAAGPPPEDELTWGD